MPIRHLHAEHRLRKQLPYGSDRADAFISFHVWAEIAADMWRINPGVLELRARFLSRDEVLWWGMEIVVNNRQRKVPVRLKWLRDFAAAALEECRQYSDDDQFALRQLPEVEVAIVSDAVIAKVHVDFMDIPGATDVITFEHGEIVISAETAASYATDHGHTADEELALYIVHGLLHLNGFDDTTAAAKKRMFRVQDKIWAKLRKAFLAR